MARSYPRAQPGRMKTELTGASIVFGAGHARDESLDVPIVPQDFLPAWNIRECPYFLRVQGDSMRDAGILEGDLAICEPRQFAANGEIVVALVGGEEATVKRFFYRGDHIELRPENDRHPVQTYTLGEVLIQGKVIGIQRGPEQMAAL